MTETTQNNSQGAKFKEKRMPRDPKMRKGQMDSASSLAVTAKVQMWVGGEFPHITMSNNVQLTIIGCMRQ